ncbi:FAD binding domain-containing protein [Bacillus canaveralius]|uniref:FAD binding domain-containing protein n=1 Tax=Bacillus canaveralius TaxID=1403243 RepID=UPI000F7A8479|nr:xanthine dehydrogenase family protein subunit M [Bacillus canaveralius]RSK55140.1 xanthine dehydrogenase family protein subunit M [Bacillus canaveralius]
MLDFNWIEPDSLDGVKEALASGDPNTRIVSGGTALSLIMKQGIFTPENLISLKKVRSALDYITVDIDGNLLIGALTTLHTIETSPLVQEHAPVVAKALRHVANPRIRYVASIGGNLAHGDAHLDIPPILLAMDAKVKVESTKGTRLIELKDLYQGYYVTTIEPEEILTEVMIPKQSETMKGTYLKYTTLSNDDWPTVGVAVFINVVENIVSDIRITVSAATEVPTRLAEAENILRNQQLSEKLIEEAAEIAFEIVEPLEDLRGTVWYKKEMTKVHVRRALIELKQEGGF